MARDAIAPPEASVGHAHALRESFQRAGYTADGVQRLLGPVAHAALVRSETVPARRATTGGSALETLVRLFLLQLPVPRAAADAALPLEAAAALGVVGDAGTGEHVRALVDVRPYAEAGEAGSDDAGWWVASDLGTGLDGVTAPLREDHVVGIGGASTTLAQLTVREPVGSTLDVGTGSGVQALHAGRHSRRVVATDISARALWMARLTTLLSGVEVELRRGSLLEPVAGEQFDLVVSNPPFVVSPGGRHTYRDSGLPLDEVCARLVREAPAHLAEGGTFQALANWVHVRGQDWQERVAGWLPASGIDALVVQREVQDPAEYVALWLRDSGEAGGATDEDYARYLRRYDEWLAAFEAAGVERVGFGTVSVRRTPDPAAGVRTVDWPFPVEQPLGPHVAGWFTRREWLGRHDGDTLLTARVRLADDVVQEQVGRPGEEHPEHVVLRQQVGFRRAFRADTATAGLVGACDGRLPLGALIDAVASVLDDDPAALRERLAREVRTMVEWGVLAPV